MHELCFSLMTECFLEYLNAKGQELGYPFNMYANGECGKGLVSADGKSNAVLKVLNRFAEETALPALESSAAVMSYKRGSQVIYDKVVRGKRLTAPEQLELLEGFEREFIKGYLQENRLYYQAEFRLLSEGSEDMIMFYLRKWGAKVSNELQEKLLFEAEYTELGKAYLDITKGKIPKEMSERLQDDVRTHIYGLSHPSAIAAYYWDKYC